MSTERSGGSVGYYSVEVSQPTTKGRKPYVAECNDIIEALHLEYAEANVLKAIWRIAKARQGEETKEGVDPIYDAQKMVFFSERALVKAIRDTKA